MGTRIKYSNGRRLVHDVITLSRKFPAAGLTGDFDAGEVNQLRRLGRPKISWNVLYMKAYSLLAAEMPELRQCYVGFPRPHLYQHDDVVCMLTMTREYEGEERLFFARFGNPQENSLDELQQRYDYLRTAPVEEIKQFRHQIHFAKVPGPIRKLIWWTMFNVWPAKRASHVGTMGMSISGYKGTYGNQHLGPVTTILGTDPLARKGISRLLMTFDHRVLDGAPAMQLLSKIHQKLTGPVCAELAELVAANRKSGTPAQAQQKVA